MQLHALFTISVLFLHVAFFPFVSCDLASTAARKFSWKVPNGLLRSIPALNRIDVNDVSNTIREVAVKTRPRPPDLKDLAAPLRTTGFYYGVNPSVVTTYTTPSKNKDTKRFDLKDTVTETLDELRNMRREMELLRQELQAMKKQLGVPDEDDSSTLASPEDLGMLAAKRRKRQREFDKLGAEIEKWATHVLFEQDGEVDGWTEIECNKVLRQAFNRDGRTRAYLKWMKDSRGSHADHADEREYPCIKVYSTIDAPIDVVCKYLSQDVRVPEYNDLVDKHRDLEEISPHAKICWGVSPQVLFIKPRDFVTFCYHRWMRDGTQVILNQAVEHEDAKTSKLPRAHALRGANFISPDTDDPEKTRIAMVAHASPGNDIPNWACKTAVNTLAPIEPFKLFNRINEGVKRNRVELERRINDTEMVSLPGRSHRPGGMAGLGFACFWPSGGGLKEGSTHHQQHLDDEHGPTDATESSFDRSPGSDDDGIRDGVEHQKEATFS